MGVSDPKATVSPSSFASFCGPPFPETSKRLTSSHLTSFVVVRSVNFIQIVPKHASVKGKMVEEHILDNLKIPYSNSPKESEV